MFIEKRLEWEMDKVEGDVNNYVYCNYLYRTREICMYKNCKKMCTDHLDKLKDSKYAFKKKVRNYRKHSLDYVHTLFSDWRGYGYFELKTKFLHSSIRVRSRDDRYCKQRYINFILPNDKNIIASFV